MKPVISRSFDGKTRKSKVFDGKRELVSSLFVLFSFLTLGFITAQVLSPSINSTATSQTIEGTVGPYTMSMSNNDSVAISFVPTETQTVYKKEANVTVMNTCPYGATITMTSNTSKNTLIQTDAPSGRTPKEIPVTSTTNLSDNSWGYSVDNGTTWGAVPIKTGTPIQVYNSASAQTSALAVPMMYGLRANNTLESGTYENTVIYTMTPKPNCYSYSITWDMDGGTGKSGITYPSSQGWTDTLNLSNMKPTREDYIFQGWTQDAYTFTGDETSININPGKSASITMKAVWEPDTPYIPASSCTGTYGSQVDVNLAVNGTKDFDYTGNVQCAILKKAGYYKLEVWGGSGGSGQNSAVFGHGGYAYGNIRVKTANSSIYVVVAGQGTGTQSGNQTGGYNGGGSATSSGNNTGAGGGATHIATTTGLLSSLSSSANQKKVLIVAGGGGGAGDDCSSSSVSGGNGGGYTGGKGGGSAAGTQTTGYQFGLGETGNNSNSSGDWAGGGGGWYGGKTSSAGENGASGGSGYIANDMLLANKGMYMYSGGSGGCTASTDASTKTTCTSNSSTTATANYAKQGNGYAKITYLGTSI